MSKRYYFDSIGRTIGDNETNDFLNGYQVANLLNELHCNLTTLENTTNMLDSIGLLNLRIDYNLTWEAVYNIVKESIEDE